MTYRHTYIQTDRQTEGTKLLYRLQPDIGILFIPSKLWDPKDHIPIYCNLIQTMDFVFDLLLKLSLLEFNFLDLIQN